MVLRCIKPLASGAFADQIRPAEGRTQIGSKFRERGFSLPFRSQSVEKLGENYQPPKIKSTRLT
jgi:hypothetical protein